MNLQKLKLRQQIISYTRDFFDSQNFQEVTTPVLSRSIPDEQNIYPFTTKWSYSKDNLKLSTSPESSLKQLISQGLKDCYAISHSFRNLESSGPSHQPEFLMLEFYKIASNYIDIMDITENYIHNISQRIDPNNSNRITKLINTKFDRIPFSQLFNQYCLPHSPKTLDQLISGPDASEPDLNQLFLNHVDPVLQKLKRPIFITDYPSFISPLAALKKDPLFSERFEIYFGNLEIANGNTENQNPKIPVTWTNLPACAGAGLGIDRLAMLLTNSDHIDQVTPFPL